MSIDPKFFVLAILLGVQPALADGKPQNFVPDPGRPGWGPGGTYTRPLQPASPPVGVPIGNPGVEDGNVKVDSEGTRYTEKDVELGFLAVPAGYRRYGGGLAYIYTGSAPGAPLPPGLPPDPNDPTDPKPPNPDPKPVPVPGPLPILGLLSAFFASRTLRKRCKPCS